MTQLDLPLSAPVVALAREVVAPWTCWYGQRSVLGTVRALGWFGRHHCVFCAVEATS